MRSREVQRMRREQVPGVRESKACLLHYLLVDCGSRWPQYVMSRATLRDASCVERASLGLKQANRAERAAGFEYAIFSRTSLASTGIYLIHKEMAVVVF